MRYGKYPVQRYQSARIRAIYCAGTGEAIKRTGTIYVRENSV